MITRRGAYELTIDAVPHFVDPLVATFWNRGDYYRVRHMVSGGDECTIFLLSEQASQEIREQTKRRAASAPRNTFKNSSRSIDGQTYLMHRAALAQARSESVDNRNARNASARRTRPHTSDARNPVPNADPLAVEESAFEFLQQIVKNETENSPSLQSRERTRIVAHAREILASEFRQRLSLASVARDVNCSPFHLSRLFRQATGVSLYRAVVRLRLREGLERLLDAPEQISTVALDTGFASHSHFADAFRAEYHCSPSDARMITNKSA
ncbi:MAG: AraC family transcriptional regulator [Gemmatimonadaceae bacterium]